MDNDKINAWANVLEKVAGLVALLCLTVVMVMGIIWLHNDIKALLLDGRGAAIFAVSLLSVITLIVMLLNAKLKTALQKVLLVLVGALAGLLGQAALPQYVDDEPAVTSQMAHHRSVFGPVFNGTAHN